MKKFLLCSFIVMFMAMLCLPAVTSAQFENLDNDLAKIGNQAGLQDSDTDVSGDSLTKMIGNIIKVVLGFLGIIMLALVIYGGFLYMTSGGGDDGVKKGKTMITNAVIGLVIVLLAYSITSFVINKMTEDVLIK